MQTVRLAGDLWGDESLLPDSARFQAYPSTALMEPPDQYGIAWEPYPPAHLETSVRQPEDTLPVVWFAEGFGLSEPIENVNLLVNIQE